jgi:adenosylmethionine-8-amino-7-oxononanoate aminotransferase
VNDAALKQLQKADKAFPPSPFTNHQEMHAQSTHVIVSGEGCYLTRPRAAAARWTRRTLVRQRGLRSPRNQRCRSGADEPAAVLLLVLQHYQRAAIRLAERLARLAPARLQHTVFSNSGSEANETALKIIRSVEKLRGKSGKTKILSREFSYTASRWLRPA